MPSPRLAALALPPVVGSPQVLIPAGRFDAPRGALRGGGPWTLTPERGAALAVALRQRGRDIPIDYEHQTLHAASNGQPAPAAGWITPAGITWEPAAGLVAARVDWTERAAGMIGAGEYRYLSPVFAYAEGGAVLDLYHVALTNTPALDALPEVALAALSSLCVPEPPMDDLRERVLYLLNLPLTTTDQELLAALDKLKAMLGAEAASEGTAATSLFDLLNQRAERIAALATQVQSAAPPALIAELQGQIAALTAAEQGRAKSAMLTAALADGRLLQDSPLHRYAADLEATQLQALLGSLTPIAALSGTQTAGRTPPDPDRPAALTPEQIAVCAQMGLDHDTYRAALSAAPAEEDPV